MSHPELAIAGLYDHEHETVREKQRRIPDWGGDDVFATTPRRRRFEHAERGLEGGVRMRLRDTHEHPLPVRRAAAAPDPALTAAVAPLEAEASMAEPYEALAPAPLADDPYMAPPEIAANGRRTVTITGHPGTARAHRSLDAPRRPPRTLDERIAHAPERIAMWAFALGLLLIVIAIATSS